MDDKRGITFQAIFVRATTTVGGGWRVSFDLNPDEADKISELSQLRDYQLQLAVVPIGEGDGLG